MQRLAIYTVFLLFLLAVAISAKPDVVEVFSNPGFLGIGAKEKIVDFKPNGVEEVIDVNNGFLGLGASTTVRDYYYNPYGYSNYGYGNSYGNGYNNGYRNNYYGNYGYGSNGYNNYYNNYNRGYYYGNK